MGRLTQLPVEQLWQLAEPCSAPGQELLQQTPFTQWPVVQSVPTPQELPFGRVARQVPLLQKGLAGFAQSVLLVQERRQSVPAALHR